MIQAWDADGHIYESEETFSDKYWPSEFKDYRPRVIEVDDQGTLMWFIDRRLFPVGTGPSQKLGGSPASKGGVPSPSQRRKIHDPMESAELRSAAARIAQLDSENVYMQINYPTMLLSWPLGFSPGLGTAIARSYNSWIADISSQAPDRLKWVTVIDPSDLKEAAKEIYRTKDLGSSGVMVWGITGNMHLDHPDYEQVWAAANETGLPVAVHPGFTCPPMDDLYTTSNETLTVPFVFPVVMSFHKIIASGILDKYPNLKVGFMETGCQWVPFMCERIEENSGAATRTTSARDSNDYAVNQIIRGGYHAELEPEDYIKRGQVFVGFEVNERMIPHLIEEFGDECWLYASDIPHAHRMYKAGDYFWNERKDVPEASKRKMLVDNTARFYGLQVPSSAHAEAATR